MCLEFEAGCQALLLPQPSCWKGPGGVSGLVKNASDDSDASCLASGGSLSFHPGHHIFVMPNNMHLAITEMSLGLEEEHVTAAVPLSHRAPCGAAVGPGLPPEKSQRVVLVSPSCCTESWGSVSAGSELPVEKLSFPRLGNCSFLVR